MSKHDRVPVHSIGLRARKARERKAAIDRAVNDDGTFPTMTEIAERLYDAAYANGRRDAQ